MNFFDQSRHRNANGLPVLLTHPCVIPIPTVVREGNNVRVVLNVPIGNNEFAQRSITVVDPNDFLAAYFNDPELVLSLVRR